MKADDRGRVDLDSEECKGCGYRGRLPTGPDAGGGTWATLPSTADMSWAV
ncbi:MAG: hypothetical protein KGM92_11930 [Acidobacteriota bacterium]|nr:hypothetical protein [Acidobacteriota bacterium]